MGSFWLWGWWFFLTLPDRLSCPLFIYMVPSEFEFTLKAGPFRDARRKFIITFPQKRRFETDLAVMYDSRQGAKERP